jgi:hypothetical protein
MVKKYNILLDMDECILQSIFQNEINENFYLTKGPHKIVIPLPKKDSKGKLRVKFIAFVRPHLEEFLKFLFKHFNVGIWTMGPTDYAKSIIENVFKELDMEDEFKKLICYITRNSDKPYDYGNKNDINAKKPHISYSYDIINKKTFKTTSNLLNVKQLSTLFNDDVYKKLGFNSSNTILIDNAIEHNGINNGMNVITVPAFKYLMACDKFLPKLQKYLQNILINKKVNLSTYKLKQFIDTTTDFYNERLPKLMSKDYITKIESDCKTLNGTNKGNKGILNKFRKSLKKGVKGKKSKHTVSKSKKVKKSKNVNKTKK